MPGIPTKIVVADLVCKRLDAQGSPQAALLRNGDNLPYFYLGALGATLGDLMSARPEVGAGSPNSPYFQVWLPVLSMFAGTSAPGNAPASAGVYKDMKQLRDTLDKANTIISDAIGGNPVQKDIQKVKILGMVDELNGLTDIVNDLQKTVAALANLRTGIGKAIFTSGPQPKTAPSSGWQVRDTLHGSHTGQFLKALTEQAADDKQRAYALGATVGYATDLCGSPFINNVVGAPYRTHWWRQRWISNYIDTWVYGYYRAGGETAVQVPINGVPTPFYTDWPNLCSAGLHRNIELPGLSVDTLFDAIRTQQPVPAALPQPFVDYWKNAYQTAYGAPVAGGAVDDADLQSGYAMTWLILWLQTSGDAIPCIPGDQIPYPDNCGSRPPWVAVDGSVTTGNGTVTQPPKPQPDNDPSVAEVISGIVLAILAVAGWVGTLAEAGIEAIAAAVLVADAETDPAWDALHCSMAWTLAYLDNFTNAMHDLLMWAGLGFPYTYMLAHNDIELLNTGTITPPDAALNTVLSKGRNPLEPASRWSPLTNPGGILKSNWANPPQEAPESPAEFAYPVPPTWPYHFINGLQFVPQPAPPAPPVPAQQINPIPQGAPPLVRDRAQFTARQGALNAPDSIGSLFGNAVDVSLELILNARPEEFLDWDLDGDPGIGFPTWQLPTAASPRSAGVPEP
jgi:hypothetical protein